MYGKLKKQTAIVLALTMLLGLLNLWPASSTPQAAAADSGWPANVLGGTNMPFRPTDSLVTTQNPPDFSWPFVTGADKYDLQVSRDSSFATVAHENDAIQFNYYNFPVTFDAGTWYWRVRYHQTSGAWSDWSTARKFRIDADNVPFAVPAVDTLMGKVSTAHPRVWTTPAELTAFRNLRLSGNSKTVFDQTVAAYNASANKPLPADPTFPYMNNEVPTNSDAYVAAQQALKKTAEDALNDMQNAAFLYLVTGNATYGNRAKTLLLNLASWNPNGATSYRIHDQVHRSIAYRSAIAYDWLYDLLSESDKSTVRDMVKARTNTLVQNYLSNQGFYKFPYDSHGWTIVGYIGLIATAMLNDMPEAAEWYRLSVPLFINVLPPWGGEDGSWSQGTGYWQWSSGSNKELMDVLLSSGAINVYDKAFSRNEGLYPLYMFPHGSPIGVFGDDSQYTPGAPSVSLLTRMADIYDDSRLKWEAEAIGAKSTGLTDYFYRADDVGSQPPVDLPKGIWFPDTGAVAMHSELYETDRTSLYFRSSPYGTYNHTMSDQNSFVVNAFGESLAVKAGYYDFYGSKHHSNFTRQTFSANAITFDGRKGQANDNINADGKVLGFVTSPDFDATSGDATAAYQGGLSKAVRHIIYVRPSVYVVVDDLATTKDGGSEFEWNLHADDNLVLDQTGKGATIAKGDANLKVQFYGAEAQSYRMTYETQYLGLDGVAYPPTGNFAGKSQIHAAFVTPRENQAKMIATLAPYKRGEAPANVTPTEYANYVKLAFEDGTTVYVRKTDSGLIDTGADGVQFDGAAAAVKGDTALLVVGTKLVKNGVAIIDSDSPATVSYGGDQLSVSAQADVQVTLAATGLTAVRDADTGNAIPSGGTVADGMNNRGVQWTFAGDKLTMHVEKGQRAFKLNAAPMPGALAPVTLQTEIDGVAGSVTLQAYRDVNGDSVAWGQLSNAQGFYEVLEAPAGFSFQKYGKIASGLIDANASILLKGATGVLKLKNLGSGAPLQTEQYQDPEQARQTLGIEWQEAESFTQWNGTKQPTIYDTRSFLSNGKGVSNWDQFGVSLKWKLNVPEEGNYDLVVKYVAGWDVTTADTNSIRYVKLGDDIKYFKIPKTESFGSTPEQWRGLRVKTGVHLSAGVVDLTMYHSLGGMNLDWIGLIKVGSDEIRPSAPANLHEVTQADGQITIGWDPSTDNVAVKEYEIEMDGVKKLTVPFGTNTATITGLSSGVSYAFRVTAVDTSGNRSYRAPGSAPVVIQTVDTTPPVWGADAAVHTRFLSSQMVRLSWEPAVDNAGKVSEYQIYRVNGTTLLPVGTTKSTTFDVMRLQAGGTFTFKVEAKDNQNNATTDGPDVTATLPSSVTLPVYDTFDNWTTGEVADASGWSYTKTGGTSVSVASLPDGGNGLVALDNYFPSSDQYASSPVIRRVIANTGGKLTVETRTMFSKVDHDVGNYLIDLSGNGKVFAGFVGFSDGGIGFQKLVNGVNTNIRLTEGYQQPKDQWMTIRYDIDFDAKTYDLTVQEDGLKNYGGTLVAGGQLDRATGTYRVVGIPFLDTSATLKGFEMFRFSAQRYTGKYTFDYLAVYPTAAISQSLPAPKLRLASQTNTSATLAWDASSDPAVKSYAIYQNGTLKTTVPASANTATLTGLTLGAAYTFAIRAVDQSDKTSPESRSLSMTLAGAPTWDATAALRADLTFTNAVRLTWDPATAGAGQQVASYTVYKSEGSSAAAPAGTATSTTLDVADLTPGATYTFRVQAKNAAGGESADGPTLTMTLPATGKMVYDSFDAWPTGEASDGAGWTYTKTGGTSVQAVALSDLGGKGLQAVDNYDPSTDAYASSPIMQRTTGSIGGLVTLETRTKFSKIDSDVGHYLIDLAGNGKIFGEFVGFSDGGLGYQKLVNGTPTFVRLTDYNVYKQPADEWVSLRFDFNFTAKTYALTVQADSLKTYGGSIAAGGSLDASTGVYRVTNIPFMDPNNVAKGFDLFRFTAQRFTGKYTFDKFVLYNTNDALSYVATDATAPVSKAKLSATATTYGGETEWFNEPVTLNLDATDDDSGVERTEYRINDGDWTVYGGAIPAFGDGVYKVDYRSVDAAGNSEDFQTVLLHIDLKAPELGVELDPASVWPPNNKMVDVRAKLTPSDSGSGVASVVLTSVTSDEQLGQGDIEARTGTADTAFRLRASRAGSGDGRVYSVTYTVTDKAGNRTAVTKTVTVPHNK
ncbi:Fibronectin type III domain-containing protein [Cohnella sp. OV330]|uniref:DUF4962 domain-containing protein n=1 Tax=Cohnella sp. OV330 TaxID=1855288 RepID=UPI0008E67103|nr:DUF4962 domain-containing protein [Cohnella sp. OV330]SFA73435.1 Fibronectin type III domain-containing protein [Cohnella sp. OV330]